MGDHMDALFGDWDRAARTHMVLRNDLDRGMNLAFVRLLSRAVPPRFVDGRAPYGSAKRRRTPRRHPTKGFRGAHKLFRGGSR